MTAIPNRVLGPALDLALNPGKIDLEKAKMYSWDDEDQPFTILDVDTRIKGAWKLNKKVEVEDDVVDDLGHVLPPVLYDVGNRLRVAVSISDQGKDYDLKKGFHTLAAIVGTIVGVASLTFAYVLKSAPAVSAALKLSAEVSMVAAPALALIGVTFLAYAAFHIKQRVAPSYSGHPINRLIDQGCGKHIIASVFAKALGDFKALVKEDRDADSFIKFLKDHYMIKIINLSDANKKQINKFVAETKLEGTKFHRVEEDLDEDMMEDQHDQQYRRGQ